MDTLCNLIQVLVPAANTRDSKAGGGTETSVFGGIFG